jgi:hypothetical protein
MVYKQWFCAGQGASSFFSSGCLLEFTNLPSLQEQHSHYKFIIADLQ